MAQFLQFSYSRLAMLEINENDCVDILKSKLGHADFSVDGYKVNRVEQLLGFHASYATLSIRATVVGAADEFKFFVKIENANPEINDKYWRHTGQFYKERIFFTSVLEDLQKFVDRKITAKCHLSKPGECLIMEDLNSLNFEVCRLTQLDFQHVKMAIMAFANLHAGSILYEERTGVSLREKFGDIDFETLFPEREGMDEYLLKSLDAGSKAVFKKYFDDWSEDECDRLFIKMRNAVVNALCEPNKFRSVVCQGDPWGNNILYKYNDNGEPEGAILVDFGSLRFGSPALDLMQFIYVGTERDLRIKCKSEIIDTYYKHLTEILSKNGLDANSIFPEPLHAESCKYHEEFAVAINVYYHYAPKLPERYVQKVASTVDNYLGFLIRGDSTLSLEACEADESYRKNLLASLKEAAHFFKSTTDR